jgi:hypothetical protein
LYHVLIAFVLIVIWVINDQFPPPTSTDNQELAILECYNKNQFHGSHKIEHYTYSVGIYKQIMRISGSHGGEYEDDSLLGYRVM